MSNRIPGQNRNKWRLYPALIISALCLLLPAFYNHYPLVNPDTATYLASGFKPETPFDRPITYGLLIRLFSLHGLSLWLVVFGQAYIMSWLIYRIFRHLADGKPYILKGLLVVFLLSIGTSLSWIVSQVQPDVFTSIAFLCIIVILMGEENKVNLTILYLLFFTAVAVHFSHPLLLTGMLLLLLIFRKVYAGEGGGPTVKKILVLATLSLGSILIMGSALSKSKHVFFVGSLLQKGVLKQYLDDNCTAKNYKICQYKDELPVSADQFWWDAGSPLNKLGKWQDTKPDFNAIIRDILTTPKYLKMYLAATCRQTVQQAATFNIGDGNQSFSPGDNVSERIAEYFPHEATSFQQDTENRVTLLTVLTLPNRLFAVIVITCLLFLGFIFANWSTLSPRMKLEFIVCLSGILLNCLDCAAFGTVNGRYGCKMIWLIPFCVLVFAVTNKRSNAPAQDLQ